MSLSYLHLTEGQGPPVIGLGLFKAVIVADQDVAEDWRGSICDWLVGSGCLYAMAWGTGCGAWHDAVDIANLSAFGWGEIPEERHVMTTWHETEPLAETFWYAGFCAFHPTIPLAETLILHIGPEARRDDLLKAYVDAQQS